MAKVSKSRADRECLWRKLIHEQQHSGQPIKVFCRRHWVSEPSFFAWRKKLAARDGIAKPTFIPLQLSSGPKSARGGVEIFLEDRLRLRVDPGFDAQTLRDVLAVLQGRPC